MIVKSQQNRIEIPDLDVQDEAAPTPARFYDDYDVDGNPDHLDVLEAVLEMINRQKAKKESALEQKGGWQEFLDERFKKVLMF